MNRLLFPSLVFCVIMAGLYYANYTTGIKKLQRQTIAFVTGAVTDIASTWDPQVYRKYVDVPPGGDTAVAAVFASYRRLGAITRAPQCGLKDFSAEKSQKLKGVYVDVSYECLMGFQTGPAKVEVNLFHFSDKVWKIRYFQVVSNYFTYPHTP